MNNILVRRVAPNDYEDIFILNLALGYSYPKEKLKDRIQYILDNTKDVILVAIINEEVVGYIHASPYQVMYSEPLMNILGFVVKEKYRNIGIGHTLITDLENAAKENGYTGIRLASGTSRIDAHRFYEKHGYITRKEQKNFFKIFNDI